MARDLDPHRYDDMLYMEQPEPKTMPRMSMNQRAAQFTGFRALTGHSEMLKETSRVVDQRLELDEMEKALLDEKLAVIMEHIKEQPEISVTYFVPDELKEGGVYIDYVGRIKRISLSDNKLIFTDGTVIDSHDIISIDSKYFIC